jgi:ribosomal protein S14
MGMHKLTATVETRSGTRTETHNGTAQGIEMVRQTIRQSAPRGSVVTIKVQDSQDPRSY